MWREILNIWDLDCGFGNSRGAFRRVLIAEHEAFFRSPEKSSVHFPVAVFIDVFGCLIFLQTGFRIEVNPNVDEPAIMLDTLNHDIDVGR